MRLRSYAKINLSLKIKELREDRFHEIDSVMQSVSLFDEVSLERRESGISVECSHPKVPSGKENIAYGAAEAFFKLAKVPGGVAIRIDKTIPPASGLAGGSGNAAAVLAGLNSLFGAPLSRQQLLTLGEEVGSDVPFCLIGGRCSVRGRGEIVEQLPVIPKMHFAIVVPDIEVSTKWAYGEYDRWAMKRRGTIKAGACGPSGAMINDLEEPISAKHGEIASVKKMLLSEGALSAAMSGSGPSVFGIAPGEPEAVKIVQSVKKHYGNAFVASSVYEGVSVL